MDAGQQLFEARQRRGLTLDDISRTTKIPVSLLSAIERNDTTRLPHGFFTRAFVRAYAKEVGLNGDELQPAPIAPPRPAVQHARHEQVAESIDAIFDSLPASMAETLPTVSDAVLPQPAAAPASTPVEQF